MEKFKTKEEILKENLSKYWQKEIDKKEHPLILGVLKSMEEYKNQKGEEVEKIEKSSFPNFELNEKVKIINKIYDHKFKIGEEVIIEIINKIVEDYLVRNNKGIRWVVRENEIEKI